MKKVFLPLLLAGIVLFGAGCVSSVTRQDVVPVNSIVTETSPQFQSETISNGLEKILYRYGSSTEQYLLLYKVDPAQYDLTVEHATSARSIADWQISLGNPALVANGGYFHEDNLPSGMLVSHGKRIGTRAFDFDKSATLELSPTPEIIDTRMEDVPPYVQNAIQSYPLLLKNGMPQIETDSGLLARRTFFGFDSEGFAYIGILPDAELSLYELAQNLKKMPISWDRVINLDGGPSSGVAVRNGDIENSIFPVPNVIVVQKKETRPNENVEAQKN